MAEISHDRIVRGKLNNMRRPGIFFKIKALTPVSMIVLFCSCWSCGASSVQDIKIWIVPPFSAEKILPDSNLGVSNPKPVLRIVATPGEMESASFVIRSHENINNLLFLVSDLEGINESISGRHVDIRFVKAWYQADGAWRNPRIRDHSKRVLVPELLLKDADLIRVDYDKKINYIRVNGENGHEYIDISTERQMKGAVVHSGADLPVIDKTNLQPLTLPGGKNQQLLVNISVPKDTPPGEYVGELVITKEGEAGQFLIPIVLTVLSFKLESSPLVYGIYYRGQLYSDLKSVTSELKSKRQLALELENIYKHGIGNPVVFQGNNNPASASILSRLRSMTLLDQYLEIRDQIGYPKDYLFYLGLGAVGAADNKAYAKDVIEIAHKHGYDNVYFYGRDEASGGELRAQREAWMSVHMLGGKVFAASNKHDILQEQMADILDVAILARELRPDEARSLRKKGVDKVLSYNNPQSAVENPYMYRRNYGYALWGGGYDGAMIYAYQHGFGSVWNDFDHSHFRDHCLTYPTQNGIIDTLAWEGLREAIDDIKYLATLQKELKNVFGELDPDVQALRSKVLSLHDLLKTGSDWQPDEIRARIIEYIVTLRNVSKARKQQVNE